jgi:hypothetical protein
MVVENKRIDLDVDVHGMTIDDGYVDGLHSGSPIAK